MKWWSLSLIIIFVLANSCKRQEQTNLRQSQYIQSILRERAQKDSSFIHDKDSPIPQKELSSFKGLHYYPVDPAYKIECQLHILGVPDTFNILTSRGILRPTLRYGYFDFILLGKENRLYVYKLLDIQDRYPDYLFVPFLDETSGKETYEGGRYLDLKVNDSGKYVLDFNLAYNPLCAYGRKVYRCPIPPEENRLKIAIRAGEKKWH